MSILRRRRDACTEVAQVDERLKHYAELRAEVKPEMLPQLDDYIDGWLDRRNELTKGGQ